MRVVSWNMGGGFSCDLERHQAAWSWVRGYDADVFLLQEAVPPDWAVEKGFATVHFREKKNASFPRWGSGVFTRAPGWLTYTARDDFPWLGLLDGSCAIARPALEGLPWLVSLHSSATYVPTETLALADAAAIRRCDDAHVWEIDLIADSLERLLAGERFLAGGDLNSSLMLDAAGRDSNARLFDNLRAGGFCDLRTPAHPHPEPQTFFRQNTQPLQLDYFLADTITADLATGWTVLGSVVTDLGLSDHAPIQIDIDTAPRPAGSTHERGGAATYR